MECRGKNYGYDFGSRNALDSLRKNGGLLEDKT